MKISLFQGIVIGVFVGAAAIGLFVFATYSGKKASNSVGTVVIWGTLPGKDMQSVITTLGQSNQDLKSVSYIQKDQATIANDLASAIATNAAPDLVLASQEDLLGLTKYIDPIQSGVLSARTFTDSFVEGAGIFEKPDGNGYYGIPFLVDPIVLFSNRALLSSSGVARAPATWEALVGLAPQITILNASRQVVRGVIGFGTYDNVRDARAILSTLFIQMGVPIAARSSYGQLMADLRGESLSEKSSGQSVLSFYTQFADPAKISYTWNASLPDSEQSFLAGDLALYLGYASRAQFLKSANPNVDLGMTPVPQPANAQIKRAFGRIYAFMVPNGAKNPSGAYTIAFLFAGAGPQQTAASVTGLAPANLGVLATKPKDPFAAIAYAEALYTRGWISPLPRATDAVFSAMVNSVISGMSSFETALTTAEQALNALLQS